MSSRPAEELASDNDFSNASNDTLDSTEQTNQEIRERYCDQIRMWLTTVHSCQMYYKEFQHDLLLEHYRQQESDSQTTVNDDEEEGPAIVAKASDQFIGFRCRLPPLWKRIGAELIDFLILSCIKLFIANLILGPAIETKLAQYERKFLKELFYVEHHITTTMTLELILIEVLHRLIICVYEAYWLQGGTIYRRISGASCGKIVFEIKVIQAENVFSIRGQPDDVIAISPGGDLGWKRSVYRSIAKNVFFAFLWSHPIPLNTATVNRNRFAYDIMCDSMVVEVITEPLRCEQSELIPIT